jgi:hypothetical protein
MEVDKILLSNSTQQAYGKIRSWYREKPEYIPKPTIQRQGKNTKHYIEYKHRKEIRSRLTTPKI